MADSGLFIGFGAPIRGRERQAIKVFNETFEYYSRLQQEGEIESFEPVILEPHGGELNGARIVAPASVRLMTSNHLPGGRDLPEMSRSRWIRANAGATEA